MLLAAAGPSAAQDIDLLSPGQRIRVAGYPFGEDVFVGQLIELLEPSDEESLTATVPDAPDDSGAFRLLGLTVQLSAGTQWDGDISLDRLPGKRIEVFGRSDGAGGFEARRIALRPAGGDQLIGRIDRITIVSSGAQLMVMGVQVLVRLDVRIEQRRPDVPEPPLRADAPTYAALPFRNLTARDDAPAELLARLERHLLPRGARFVPPDALEESLRQKRIRYTDSLSVEAARAIAADTGARWLLLGTVLEWDAGPDPRMAVLMRVLDAHTGERAAGRLVTLAGSDFEGLMGLGAIEDDAVLADEVVARLAADFGPDGAPRAPVADPGALADARPGDTFTHYAAADFDPRSIERVAILPFGNRARRGDAGLLFAEMLANRWFASTGAVVVERSELVAALVREDLRSMDGLDLELLRRIGRELGTRYFVSGSIDRFGEEVWAGDLPTPEVLAVVWVLDVERGNIVAAAGLRRTGDHYHQGLGLGIVRDPLELADRTAHELVAAVGG